MSIEIKGQQFELFKVFSNDFLFSIPRYQRPYAWNVEHAEALLDDLLVPVRSVGDINQVANLPPYFLGSIVLVKGTGPEADVIDGQQRLTTLTILLSVLRDFVPANQLEGLTRFICQPGDDVVGVPTTYRLTLRDRDAAFFREHIQDPGGIAKLRAIKQNLPSAPANIKANALRLHERLTAIVAAEPTLAARMARYLATRTFLVVVWTPDDEAAFRIFSVLNDRGLDLSHADILKADVIGAIKPDSLADSYALRWEKAEEELGRDAFKDLFAHIRMIHERRKLDSTLLVSFRRSVKPAADPVAFVEKNLLPRAAAFREILKADFDSVSHEEEINNSLRWLRFVDNFDWIPPAIEAIATLRQKPTELARLLDDLQRLASSLMLRRASVNERVGRYGKVLDAMESGQDLYGAGSPLQLSAAEKAETLAAVEGDVYNANRFVRRMILMRVSWEIDASKPRLEPNDLSVEHVLPQHPAPNSEWLTWWPNALEREASVHRLGNLAILTRRTNSSASNYDFNTKKNTYFAPKRGVSNFALTVDIIHQGTWTPTVFQGRQAVLVGKLRAGWRL